MAKTYQDYFDELGFKESSSVPGSTQNYGTENPFGYIGKYQFGEAALFDLGYYGLDNSDGNLFRNDWVGNWSGKNGIDSKQDYFNNGAIQEIIVREWHDILWERITFLELDKYEGQILNDHQITISGMLSVAHLVGAGSTSSETAGLKGYLQSGAIISKADGNGTTANTFMISFSGFQTPFTVDHSPAELITGGTGRDTLTGFEGNDTLNGNENTDTAIYRGHLNDYDIRPDADGSWTVIHQNGGVDGTDTLNQIERIQFDDISVALDLDGKAGITAKTLGAVFGRESVSNETFSGIGLSLLDDGMNHAALMQFAISAALGDNITNHTAVVNLLYENVVGLAPSAVDQAYYVGLLDSGAHTVTSIGIMAADTPLNEENINLAELSQTGMEYLLTSI